MAERKRGRVGEIRPSQLIFSFGVGSVVDLPHISAIVMGLDDWHTNYAVPVPEERLLAAIRNRLGPQVEQLRHPPMPDPDWDENPFSPEALIGVPIAPFPQWMRCPQCDLLAPLSSGLFEPKLHPVYQDRSRFEHVNCQRSIGAKKPTALPARFLVACPNGHLDDFPWRSFVHRQAPVCMNGQLALKKIGPSDEAADLLVTCSCGAKRSMAEAFGDQRAGLGPCRGAHPHLREAKGCEEVMEPILLGASNSWFPVTLSALSLPSEQGDEIARLVEENWDKLKGATALDMITFARQLGVLQALGAYNDQQIWEVVKAKRERDLQSSASAEEEGEEDLKAPEWRLLNSGKTKFRSDDFLMRIVDPPLDYEAFFEKTVMLDRLREVRALISFTRIEPPGELGEDPRPRPEQQVPLGRGKPTWLPASEVRGEGIFLRIKETPLADWCAHLSIKERERDLFEGHRRWRQHRGIEPADEGFPGIRGIVLHSLSHTLMRQMALSGGYAAASLRERIYSRDPAEGEPMAGVLIYTAAPDSEGTLGGLVTLGEPKKLGRIITEALEQIRLCASDPLCTEHDPTSGEAGLHGAACHACLFAPETSCELANRYLDRTLISDGLGHCWPSFLTS